MSEMTTSADASVRVTWRGDRRYEVNRPGAAPATMDGAGEAGPGPVEMLLAALAACSAIDVVDYLLKRRTPVVRLEVGVDGVRRATPPRRVLAARLAFAIDGDAIDAEHAERAIALAIAKYCSVAATLAPDMEIVTQLVLNGVSGADVRQHVTRGEES